MAIFAHSLVSCWNHGNAHFLRGVARALMARGHRVRVHEPMDGWSALNLRADHGSDPFEDFARAFPDLLPAPYAADADIEALLDGADLVLVHEWNDPVLVARIGRARRAGGRFTLLFHDTHHRAVSDPTAIRAFDLSGYDGVLAFGAALAEIYRRWGWGERVFVWHEAADVSLFHPPAPPAPREGLVWIGNWGDGERGAELVDFLLAPARGQALPLDVYGVRYPPDARATLAEYGARHHGWLANAHVPSVFASHLATVHVPRRFYVTALPGIPTIRVFEALACGIPLLCAPWSDVEGLFRTGVDFLMARDAAEMAANMRAIAHDTALRQDLAAHGLETILARHTCAHRADELLRIARHLAEPVAIEAA